MDLGFISCQEYRGCIVVIFSSCLSWWSCFYREGIMGQREWSWQGLLGARSKTPERGEDL